MIPFKQFLVEEPKAKSLAKKLKGNRSVMKAIKKYAKSSNEVLAKALIAIPAVSGAMIALSNPDKLNRATLLASTLKRMVLDESRTGQFQKGWIHKSGKAILSRGEQPWHVQILVNNLPKFGIKKSDVYKLLVKRFDGWDAPDPEGSANDHFDRLLTGDIDVESDVDFLAMKKGWCRVVFDDHSSIQGPDLKTIHSVAKIIDKKYSNVVQGMLSFELSVVQPDGKDVRPWMIWDTEHWEQWIKKGGDPKKAEQGRSEIGRTMAQFR